MRAHRIIFIILSPHHPVYLVTGWRVGDRVCTFLTGGGYAGQVNVRITIFDVDTRPVILFVMGAYQRNGEEIARLGVELTVLVPPYW